MKPATFEEIVGNIFAAILIFIVILSVLYSFFVLLFRSGEGFASYGSRGEFYMAE